MAYSLIRVKHFSVQTYALLINQSFITLTIPDLIYFKVMTISSDGMAVKTTDIYEH